MSDITDQDCPSPLYWGEISHQRSNFSLFWHFETVPEQGCLIATDGVPGHKRAGNNCGRCDHGNQQHHEGYVSR